MPWVQTRLNSCPACVVSRWPVCGLLAVFKGEQIPIATVTMRWWQYCTSWDSLLSIHMLIWGLDSPGVISRTCSPLAFSPYSQCKSLRQWRLTVEKSKGHSWPQWNHTVVSAAVPDMLETQNELESKAAKWHTTICAASELFLIPLAAECSLLSAVGVWVHLESTAPGWKHSPTVCTWVCCGVKQSQTICIKLQELLWLVGSHALATAWPHGPLQGNCQERADRAHIKQQLGTIKLKF